uniref:beta-glucosidase n=1 Tax=Agaricus bisporus TaxID=5341 RepID=Q9HGX2_AGABI|nr:putative beta glucosidase [Agaricus bisporus]
MPPSDFANADIDKIVDALTTDEAILLSAGVGFWHTHAIERLQIPAVKVSDGPNGIRGNHFFMGTPAKCLPSSTAMGATFDRDLLEEVGLKLLAREAKLRSASVILAPTCNIQRNPLGGRSFESFSEDPFLSGMLCSAYINGIQKGGIGATIKHFVGNDKEDDRTGYDSIHYRTTSSGDLSPSVHAGSRNMPLHGAIMTAYNRVNGIHVCENPELLQKILRDEWKSDVMIMSDWFGTYSVDVGLNAGLDLEMPGLNKWRSLESVNRSIQSRKVTAKKVKERARKVLELVKKCAQGAPEILDGDGLERTLDSDEDNALMRKFAAESIVLLKNDKKVLPLDRKSLKKVAIVGGNAKAAVLSGGGSAALKPSYFVARPAGLVKALKEVNPNIEVTYSEGARAAKTLPTLDFDLFTESGQRGWTGSWHAHENDDSLVALPTPIKTQYVDETRMFISSSSPAGITKKWTLRMKGYLKPRERDCKFEFGLTAAGRAKLFVDGKLVIDNWTRQRRGVEFFGCGSEEETGVVELKAGVKHEIYVDFCNVRGPADGDETETIMDSNPGIRLGGAEVEDPDELLNSAVSIAKDADAVIIVVGLNGDWETEGNDRTTLALPGRTDELVQKVVAANPRAVVVTQAGSAITMPWVDQVSSLLHTWYLGNATGDAIADVIFGNHNPSGKLSLTFPKRLEDVPAHGYFHSEKGKVTYAEGLYVGYKHYQHRNIEPLFAFGHGLSYTSFNISDLRLSQPIVSGDQFDLKATVKLTNTGNITGSQVVQLYIGLPKTSELTHPRWQLRGFKKMRDVKPGESREVELVMDRLSVSYWDKEWVVENGAYDVRVAFTSEEGVGEGQELLGRFNVEKGFGWRGL